MVEMMGMDDRALFGKVMLDRLEWRDAEVATYAWHVAAWLWRRISTRSGW
jgi:hypothetical protein